MSNRTKTPLEPADMKSEPFFFGDDGGKRQPTRDPSFRQFVTPHWKGKPRSGEPVLLGIGLQYVVAPLNPKKKKHRGRPCQIVEFNDNFNPDQVRVTFLDGQGGRGIVEVTDLRPLNDEERATLGAAPWAPKPARVPVARTTGLDRTTFTKEDRGARPPQEDVEKLWNASTRLDATELASDAEAIHFFSGFHRQFKATQQSIGQPDIARWLPSYDALPCRWWGSRNDSTFYRLAVRAYEPDGTLASLHALLTKEDRGLKTGRPVGRVGTRWPKPYHTDGLLLADDVGVAALRGSPPKGLFGLLITTNAIDFLLASAFVFRARQLRPGSMGVLCVPTGATLDNFRQVHWPKDAICFYCSPDVTKDCAPALRKLEEVLGPDVIVQEFKPSPRRDGKRPPSTMGGVEPAQVHPAPDTTRKTATAVDDTALDERSSKAPRPERGPTRGPKPTDWAGMVSRSVGGSAYTYAFRFGSSEVWKIGWTENIDERLSSVNKHVPMEVTQAAWEPTLAHPHPSKADAYAMEQRLLELLNKHRTNGERVRCTEAQIKEAWALVLREWTSPRSGPPEPMSAEQRRF